MVFYNWARVDPNSLPAPQAGEGNWIASGNGTYAAVNDTIWCGSRTGRVWKSVDKGLTWTATTVNAGSSVSGLAFKDEMNGVMIGPM
jgi:hypothetical protein